jgi:hypothetical protein
MCQKRKLDYCTVGNIIAGETVILSFDFGKKDVTVVIK